MVEGFAHFGLGAPLSVVCKLVPDISVVIANWNGARFISDCLRSVEAHASALSIETIVVDNASSDDSVDLIRRDFPGTLVRCESTNLGFAGANNRGISISRGKYVCLLNSDVTIPVGCFERLYRCMENNRDIGILAPKILNSDLKLQQSHRPLPTLMRLLLEAFSVRSGRHRPLCGSKPIDVGILSGCFMMLRRTALAEVGSFDERFFFYGEDVDLCKRYGAAGWRVCYLPSAFAVHYGGASTSGYPVKYFLQMTRAKLQYWQKHGSHLSVVIYFLISCIHHTIRLSCYSFVRGFMNDGSKEGAEKRAFSRAALAFLMCSRRTEN
jgi:GT2 family glycosyltransferase